MNKFKKDDLVIVITGKDKGNTGKITKILTNDKVDVEGINSVKKNMKPTQNSKGGIVDINAPIHISNIMHYSTSKKTKSKVSIVTDKKKKVRKLKIR